MTTRSRANHARYERIKRRAFVVLRKMNKFSYWGGKKPYRRRKEEFV